jgi:Na+/proline symporter
MLLLGGSATISDLTGMSTIWAAFLIPLLSCWIYTMYGGLRATFFASYVHTTVIFIMLIVFTFAVYAGPGDSSGLYGSPAKVHTALAKASLHGMFDATRTEAEWKLGQTPTSVFSSLGSFIENDGTCYKADRTPTDKGCAFQGTPDACCSGVEVPDNQYCRVDNCVDIGDNSFKSEDCDDGAGEVCVPSFATMGSPSGILFGITNIVGNFGTVFVDQSYWQSAVAAKPKSAVFGFLVGGMVWFAVPFCMATTNGLAGRALTTHPDLGPLYIDAGASGSGLTPARVMAHILGSGGAFLLLLQLFMAITSTGSAEIIAVSSILTYDIYYEYINPELKQRRAFLRKIFDEQVSSVMTSDGMVPTDSVQSLLDRLVAAGFFDTAPSSQEVRKLASAINSFTSADMQIAAADLYASLNRAVSSNSIEGKILLRVSKFFTAIFAVFMGFLAVFLQTLDFSLGWVYMSMGVIIGSAVGPASLTILMETANGVAIGAGAVGGLALGVLGWVLKANADSGEVSYSTLGSDWPWVVGNLCAIIGGFLIAMVGSLIQPDKSFKWEMLNERIPLVDDIEPPKADDESDARLRVHVKIAIAASVVLTFVLLVLWPLPLHGGAGVFSEGGFTVWVVLEILWAMIGGAVIIVMPAIEIVMTFAKAKKEAQRAADETAALKNGQQLSIEFKQGAKGSDKVVSEPMVLEDATTA